MAASTRVALATARDFYDSRHRVRARALELNKAYKAIVEQQDFIFGRDATVTPPERVLRSVDNETSPTLPPERQHDWNILLDWQRGDGDDDGRTDDADNCVQAPNAILRPDAGGQAQRDSDGDGFGNACDTDLNNDGVANQIDAGLFRARFGGGDPHADFNGDGAVNALDAALMRSRFGQAPGPAGCTTRDL